MLTTSTTYQPLSLPVTHQMSPVKDPVTLSTADTFSRHIFVEQSTADSHKCELPEKSHTLIPDQQLSTMSLVQSFRGKVSRKRTNLKRRSPQIGQSRLKTTSVARKSASTWRSIKPAPSGSNVAMVSSYDDVKARLRELILSGRRFHQPQHGRSACCYDGSDQLLISS